MKTHFSFKQKPLLKVTRKTRIRHEQTPTPYTFFQTLGKYPFKTNGKSETGNRFIMNNLVIEFWSPLWVKILYRQNRELSTS